MAVALDTQAMVTKEELLFEIDVDAASAVKNDLFHTLINRVTSEVEREIDHLVVTRGSDVTEFHSMARVLPTINLRTLEWPIISVTSVHESNTRTYDADSLLVENTDYIVNKPEGKLIRIASSAGVPIAWDRTYRAIQVIYQGGYANVASVPNDLRGVAAELVTLRFRKIAGKYQGLSGVVNDIGNITRFSMADMTIEMKRVLGAYKSTDQSPTGERDS